jgi:hypothetical protein
MSLRAKSGFSGRMALYRRNMSGGLSLGKFSYSMSTFGAAKCK